MMSFRECNENTIITIRSIHLKVNSVYISLLFIQKYKKPFNSIYFYHSISNPTMKRNVWNIKKYSFIFIYISFINNLVYNKRMTRFINIHPRLIKNMVSIEFFR